MQPTTNPRAWLVTTARCPCCHRCAQHPACTLPEHPPSLLLLVVLLLQAGWSVNNMRHVEGGFQQWRYQDLPCEEGPDA